MTHQLEEAGLLFGAQLFYTLTKQRGNLTNKASHVLQTLLLTGKMKEI
ncbi:hypothetical protein NGI46_20005 [Peribacillus butanolivorans]|nr:hypothetical protein [Peribacillus butanolivorans]